MAHQDKPRSQSVLSQTISYSTYGLLPPPPPFTYSIENPSSYSSSSTTIAPRYVPESLNWTPSQYITENSYPEVEELEYPQLNQSLQRTYYNPQTLQPQQLVEENQILDPNQMWQFGQHISLPLSSAPEIMQPQPVERLPLAQRSTEVAESELNHTSNRKPFISKLHYLLKNPELYEDVIMWNDTGTTFIVAPSNRFIQEILPDIYSHGSFTAFSRQLNTYAFKHLSGVQLAETFSHSPDTTTPISSLSAWRHPLFTRAAPHLSDQMRPIPSKARQQQQVAKDLLLTQTGMQSVASSSQNLGVTGRPLAVDRTAIPLRIPSRALKTPKETKEVKSKKKN